MIQNPVILVELALYLLGMLLIGAYFGRKKLTRAQYHLGGKTLSGWALALSERSTGESSTSPYMKSIEAMMIRRRNNDGCTARVTGITACRFYTRLPG